MRACPPFDLFPIVTTRPNFLADLLSSPSETAFDTANWRIESIDLQTCASSVSEPFVFKLGDGVGIGRENEVHDDDAGEFAAKKLGDPGESKGPARASTDLAELLKLADDLLSLPVYSISFVRPASGLLSSSESFISIVRSALFFWVVLTQEGEDF